MSRLENMIPSMVLCSPFKANSDGHFVSTTSDQKEIVLTPFEKQFFESSRGGNSFKEIALMLYSKSSTSNLFTSLYSAIKRFCDEGLFKNAAEIKLALQSQGESKAQAMGTAKSKEELILNLRKISLFSALPLETLQSIASVSEQKIYKASDVIIKKDSVGDEVYVLLSGEVGVYASFYLAVKGVPLAVLKPVTVFGESAAVSGKKRTADVVATQDSAVLKFHISKVSDKSVGKDLNKNLRIRLIFQQLVRLHPVFSALPGDILQLLLNSCVVQKAEAHKTIVQQGETGRNFYFILSGSVNVIKDRLPQARLTVGTYFGEVGALQRQERTASIVTAEESMFLVLSETNFLQLLASNLVLALAIEKEMNSRTQPTPEEITEVMQETQEISLNLKQLKEDDFDFSSLPFNGGES